MAITFTISDEQEKQFHEWAEAHGKANCGARPDMTCALYSFTIMPTGLGDSITVHCPCGAKQFLNDESEA